jgi:hypothetical protein
LELPLAAALLEVELLGELTSNGTVMARAKTKMTQPASQQLLPGGPTGWLTNGYACLITLQLVTMQACKAVGCCLRKRRERNTGFHLMMLHGERKFNNVK